MINRIHSSTCGGGLYPGGGGAHDHNRMNFFNTGRWVHYWGRKGTYKWQFTVMKITELSHANRNIRHLFKLQILIFLFLGRTVENETNRTCISSRLC